ncbi:MAG TPA: hypothetical protein DGG94_11815, partial [Micromonosporaceae bacterium]|nr:hypothetical protein [Micromonosporaceae bacterium]
MRLRPNVLAHPSPTAGRFLLLLGVLLSAGLLSGQLVHMGLRGGQWTAVVRQCLVLTEAAVPTAGGWEDDLTLNDFLLDCMAAENRTAAAFEFAGAATIAALGLFALLLAPGRLRRRHRLRPAGLRLDAAIARVGELAAEAGMSRPPQVLVGPAGQKDAFVFGLPGRYRMVLPTALLVRWRNREVFDPVVRHELAHLRRHDVPLAWLAASIWLAAAPVIALPMVVALLRWDFSLAPSFLWRVALILAVVWLVRRQVLRSREHDADLHAAAQIGDWRPLWKVLNSTTAKPPSRWRQLISHHPTVAHRMAVLVDPAKVPGVSLVDGLAAAFLAALLLPLIVNTLNTAFAAHTWSLLAAAALVGPILGLAVGAGLWRQAMIDHATGRAAWPGGVVLGVVVGLLLGTWVDLADLGTGDIAAAWVVTVLTIAIGAGAVLLSAGTGRLWADAAARVPGRRGSWWVSLIINSLIFGFALWAMEWLPIHLVAGVISGFSLETLVIALGTLIAPITYLAIVPAIVTMFALVARRRPADVPRWLVDSQHTGPPEMAAHRPGIGAVVLSGVAAGVLGALALLVHRLVIGSPVDDPDRIARYLLWVTTGTLVALAVSLVALVMVPRSGA